MEKPQLPATTRRHPVERRRGEVGVPEDLGVVVGVDVDEAGSDHLAGGIQLGRARQAVADGHDDAVGDSHIGGSAGRVVAVHQGATTYDDVSVHPTFFGTGCDTHPAEEWMPSTWRIVL